MSGHPPDNDGTPSCRRLPARSAAITSALSFARHPEFGQVCAGLMRKGSPERHRATPRATVGVRIGANSGVSTADLCAHIASARPGATRPVGRTQAHDGNIFGLEGV